MTFPRCSGRGSWRRRSPDVVTSTARALMPASSAPASVSPTAATCGSVNVTRGGPELSLRRTRVAAQDHVGGHPGLVLAGVGEQRAAVHVADGVEPVVALRRPSGRRRRSGLPGSRPRLSRPRSSVRGLRPAATISSAASSVSSSSEGHVEAAVAARDRHDLDPGPELNAVLAQRRGHLLARERLLAREHPVGHLEQRDVGSQRAPRLRKLAAHGAAADHEQAVGHRARRSFPGGWSTARPRRARRSAAATRRCRSPPPRPCARRARRRRPGRGARRRAARVRGSARSRAPRARAASRSRRRSWITSSRRARAAPESTSSEASRTPGTRPASPTSSPGPHQGLRGHAGVERALAADQLLLAERDGESVVRQPPGDHLARPARPRSR